MKKLKNLFLIFLASNALILGVNVACNCQYYLAGNDWHFSVYYCLIITSIGWLGGLALYYLFFKNMQWTVNPTRKLLTSVLIFAFYGFLLMAGSTKCMVLFFHLPEQSLQDYIINSSYSILISIIIGLLVSGFWFLQHLKKSIEDNESMKQQMLLSQYETLKSQVNPHFLFNSLNTLTVMIPRQPQAAVSFVEQLSKVFRYSLQHSGENTIDVGSELKVVRSYLFLNEQRFDGKLKTDIRIGEEDLNKGIITQSLLMLVENAIKHNEISHSKPLLLSIYSEGNYIVVANTLQRKDIIERSTNTGLINITKRYALATPTPVIITETGNSFIVKIPLL